MGQTQIKQNNSIQTLIKDIEQINRISKLIPQELNITIQADLVQNQSKNYLIKFFSKVEICIMFKVNQNTKYMTIENFEKIKPLLNDLAYILNKKQEDEICFICFEQKREKILTCGHSYCSNCIDGWFNNKDKDSCPMCRTRITKQKMLTESYCLPNDQDLIESLIQQILDSNNYY